MIKILLIDFTNVIYLPYDHSQPLNQSLIELIEQIGERVDSYVFSASDPQVLAKYLSQLVPPFTDFLSSKKLGLKKYQKQTYQILAERLSIKPSELLFVDDRLENVKAAQTAGCQTILFEATEDFLEKVKTYL